MEGWVAVDLDGTLAKTTDSYDPALIGEPVPAMLERVKKWLKDGKDVRIFTARVSHDNSAARIKESVTSYGAIQKWLLKHLGQTLPITCVKAPEMIEMWDDRCVAVEADTGRRI